MLTAEQKKEIIAQYAVHEGDTGSPEVQIAILSKRIALLTEHLKEHKKVKRKGNDSRKFCCRFFMELSTVYGVQKENLFDLESY